MSTNGKRRIDSVLPDLVRFYPNAARPPCSRAREASDVITGVPPSYPATRRSLHAVAEHVLAPALYRATGRIGLRLAPGGFGTPSFAQEGRTRQIRVDGVELVVTAPEGEQRAPLATLAQVAAVAGTVPGAPSLYPPVTPLDLEAPLTVEPDAAALVHGWLRAVGTALDGWRAQGAGRTPPPAQLWPEHFDLAITLDEVNYGGSPGDAEHPEPYAYVGPWNPDDLGDDVRNEPFGVSRSYRELPSPADILAFFSATRRRLR
jgi:hypothetical protein